MVDVKPFVIELSTKSSNLEKLKKNKIKIKIKIEIKIKNCSSLSGKDKLQRNFRRKLSTSFSPSHHLQKVLMDGRI